jgi:hypothetical protein
MSTSRQYSKECTFIGTSNTIGNIFTTGGNVGIGTTSPNTLLTLSGSAAQLALYPIANGNEVSIAYYNNIVGSGNTRWNVGNNAAVGIGNFGFWNSSLGAPVMALTSTGNIGIGTTAPSYKLDVNGTFRFSSGGSFIGSSTGTTAITLTGASSSNTSIYAHSDGKSYIQYYNDLNINRYGNPTSSTSIYVQATSSNVGIGTLSPSYTLDVNGTTRINNTSATSMGTLIVAGPGSTSYLPATATSGQLASFYGPGGPGIYSHIDFSTFMPTSSTNNLPSVRFSMLDLGAANSNFNILTRNNTGLSTATMASRILIDGSGNVGINTTNPAYTLDVNGTIARGGVKLPRFDNGTFSGAASFSIPILFNDTQYNYCEFRVRYTTSAICDMTISATSYASVAMAFNECALTTVKWNAQSTPVYTTFTSSATSGTFASTVETSGIDNNLTFRLIRSSGTLAAGLRNQYSYDNVYCWANIGTARGYGQGHIDNASVGGSPIQYVTFTCSTGTVSGTYSTAHYY